MKRKIRTLLIIAVVAAGAVIALKPHSVRWRSEMILAKALGRMPDETWVQVFRWVRGTYRKAPYSPLSGAARLKSTGHGGSCPALWETDFGPVRARIEDDLFLEHHFAEAWHFHPQNPKVRKGDVVVEVGAWVGCFSMCALSKGASRVIAFEPVLENQECLKMNLAREIRDGKVTVIGAAAWSAPGTLWMDMTKFEPNDPDSNEGWGVMEKGKFTVPGVTIDEALEQLQVDRVDLMNLDIEGGERHALAGAQRTLARFKPTVVVCLHHLADDEKAIPPVILGAHPSYRFAANRLGHGIFISTERDRGN